MQHLSDLHGHQVLPTQPLPREIQKSCIHLFTQKYLKAFDSEFSYIEVWSTDQNSKPLEIEDKTNITLVIN